MKDPYKSHATLFENEARSHDESQTERGVLIL
ncbi:hypothetical protein RHECNPAF_430073 [Rhizobium etli CNPAF512]|nr:hypothetical protein RHECNPAF_430073 [Rhizobium etli CNPAF512]